MNRLVVIGGAVWLILMAGALIAAATIETDDELPRRNQPAIRSTATPRIRQLIPTAPTPTPIRSTGLNCSSAYPGVCIPPAPPDLDCGDISARRFAVRPPDPHGFDADGDGIGCES